MFENGHSTKLNTISIFAFSLKRNYGPRLYFLKPKLQDYLCGSLFHTLASCSSYMLIIYRI